MPANDQQLQSIADEILALKAPATTGNSSTGPGTVLDVRVGRINSFVGLVDAPGSQIVTFRSDAGDKIVLSFRLGTSFYPGQRCNISYTQAPAGVTPAWNQLVSVQDVT
jgi:hypothetical protein